MSKSKSFEPQELIENEETEKLPEQNKLTKQESLIVLAENQEP